MPVRVSEIPQSDLSELNAMERRDDPGINSTVSTVASEFQPDLNFSTSISAPQPHTQPRHPKLIPQPQHPNLIPQPQHTNLIPQLHTTSSAPEP